MNRPSASLTAQTIATALDARRKRHQGLFVVGICGPQGSGKSTATAELSNILIAEGLRIAALSIDDLYLDKVARHALARDVHPLFETRGPPGTHDVARGIAIIDALRAGEDTIIPQFDKLADDRLPETEGLGVKGPVDILLFEGWCVGAAAQAPEALDNPVNELERTCDPDGSWRAYANAQLAGPYRGLFGRIDFLSLLRAPSFEIIHAWRCQQERNASLDPHEAAQGRRRMGPDEIRRFVAHYERITRHIDATMPETADLTLNLDARRSLRSVSGPSRISPGPASAAQARRPG